MRSEFIIEIDKENAINFFHDTKRNEKQSPLHRTLLMAVICPLIYLGEAERITCHLVTQLTQQQHVHLDVSLLECYDAYQLLSPHHSQDILCFRVHQVLSAILQF